MKGVGRLLLYMCLVNIVFLLLFVKPSSKGLLLALVSEMGPSCMIQDDLAARGIYVPYLVVRVVTVLLIVIYVCAYLAVTALYCMFTCRRYQTPVLKQLAILAHNPFITPVFEASLENGLMVYRKNLPYARQMQSKIFWDHLFQKTGVPTPRVIGVLHNGNIEWRSVPAEGKEYLIKPVFGGLGRGIQSFDPASIPSRGEYIVQERLRMAGHKGHMRLITMRRGSEVVVVFEWMFLQPNDAPVIATNYANGARGYELRIHHGMVQIQRVTDRTGPWIDATYLSAEVVEAVRDSAKRLHEVLPAFVKSVGWDIMMDRHRFAFLEGNVPHGTMIPEDELYYANLFKLYVSEG